jgi:hypothetical protein
LTSAGGATATAGGADGNDDRTCVGWGSPAGVCTPEYEWFTYVCNCPGFAGCRYQSFADLTCTTCSSYCEGSCDSDCGFFNANGVQYGPIGDDPRPHSCTCANGGGTGGGAGGHSSSGGGAGGSSGAGGVPGTGGSTQVTCRPACTADQDCIGGSCVPSPRYGMSCTTDSDCPAGSSCCDGSDGGCDETRLPPGDGASPGEFVFAADGSTVTDTITGLLWQRDDWSPRPGCSGVLSECTWQEAHDYCASLALGGLSGWRVPTPAELLTVVELAQTPEMIGFADYWTAHWTSWGSADFGIYVDSSGGLQNCGGSLPEYVLCVRGSRCYPKSRFLVLDGGLVRDTLTGLVWQQRGSSAGMTWADAQSYCSSLGPGFRLPTYRELLSLLGFSSAATTAFPGGVPGPFWTSTPYGGSSDTAYYVDYYSMLRNSCETDPHFTSPLGASFTVRCVR